MERSRHTKKKRDHGQELLRRLNALSASKALGSIPGLSQVFLPFKRKHVEQEPPMEQLQTPNPGARSDALRPPQPKLGVAGQKALSLRVSARYSKDIAGGTRSSTYEAKLKAGFYQDTLGKYDQKAYRKAMMCQALADGNHDGDDVCLVKYDRLTLTAWDLRKKEPIRYPHNADLCSQQPLTVDLSGPSDLVHSWDNWCKRCQSQFFDDEKMRLEEDTPYPIFIPTKGRARKALLNWSADHCLGPFQRDRNGLQPIVCAVVEPSEEDEYRKHWPQILLMVLPVSGRGIAFSRWTIQRICTASVKANNKDFAKHEVQRLPFVWVVDDGLTCFYRLESLSGKELLAAKHAQQAGNPLFGSTLSRPAIGRQRRRVEGSRMFAEAFCEVQKRPRMVRTAIAGFLRDDGTASSKSLQWAKDRLSIFKVVLLNLPVLQSLKVEYIPQLNMFEDVFLNLQVNNMQGSLLKSMGYCYRADLSSSGGCADIRGKRASSSHEARLFDIISKRSFVALPMSSRNAVRQLAQWVRVNEEKASLKDETTDVFKHEWARRGKAKPRPEDVFDVVNDSVARKLAREPWTLPSIAECMAMLEE